MRRVRSLGAAAAALGLLLLAAPGATHAACTIGATGVSFGAYDVFSAVPVDATGSVVFQCDRRRPVSIGLDAGSAPGFGQRRMRQGSETLRYDLYLDAVRTLVWGDGTGGTRRYVRSPTPVDQNVTVTIFGRIPAGQDVAAGPYADSLMATIDF